MKPPYIATIPPVAEKLSWTIASGEPGCVLDFADVVGGLIIIRALISDTAGVAIHDPVVSRHLDQGVLRHHWQVRHDRL